MGKKAVSRLFYYLSIALTAALASVTLAGAFTHGVSPEDSALLPFIGLALPVLLLLNIAATLYWTVRWRCWLFIPLVAILGNWAYLTGIVQLPDSPKIPEVGVVTVATYNVDSFNREHTGFSCKEIAAYMHSKQADILCFQEFGVNSEFTADSVKAALAEWPYCVIPYAADSIPLLQLALFSKYPIRESRLITYPESRNCSMWCDLEVNGKLLRVFNNHLQTTEVTRNKGKLINEVKKELKQDEIGAGTETAVLRLLDGLRDNFIRRSHQAETLQKAIEETPYPMLVCGDFNSLPSSYTYATVKGTKLKDGFQTCGHGYMYTFHHFKHLLRIDYVLHSPELEGLDYFSPHLEYSDHNPVLMRVKVK